ncbi:MAG: hypothetical protein ACP5OO_07390 [Chloroflexia bacterium]
MERSTSGRKQVGPYLRERLSAFGRTLRDILYGMSLYEWVRELEKERGRLEHLFVLAVFGDLLGLPLLPPYYTLRLLPYAFPYLAGWRFRLLREKDLTEQFDQEIG